MKKYLTLLTNPWIIITLGVVISILSIASTHVLAEENDRRLKTLMEDINQLTVLIDQTWQRKLRLDQKLDSLILYTKEKTSTDTYIIDYFTKNIYALAGRKEHIHKANATTSSLADLISLAESYQQETIHNVDELFIQKQRLLDEKIRTEQEKSTIMLYAMILHILGLIFVSFPSTALRIEVSRKS